MPSSVERAVTAGPMVIKIGGSTLGSHDTTLEDLAYLQKEGVSMVVVHGGGKVISEWLERLGARPRFVRGLRVTDAQSLEVVTAVLSGLINKQLVASITNLGGRVVGLSGVDGGLLECRLADPELGYVGEVTQVNLQLLEQTLTGGYIPLIAPVGLHCSDGSNHAGSLLNLNGDTAAGHIAYAINAARLIFLTDVEGVMDSSGRVIPRMNTRQVKMLLDSGVARGGMIPKLEACLQALPRAHVCQVIDGRKPNALRDCLSGKPSGTTIRGLPKETRMEKEV